ncbi:MAG: WD40 repeat domain-containing protein [Aggregatilineales bacterium]
MRIRRMFFTLCGFLFFTLATTGPIYGQIFYDSGRVPGWIPQHDTIYVSNGYLIRTYSPDFVVEDELVIFDSYKFQIDFYRLVWSPDGERFVIIADAYDINNDEYVTIAQLWSWVTKTKIADLTPAYGAELVAWNGDGSQIAVTYYESPANDRIHIYDGYTGQAIKSLMSMVSSKISFIFWNPDITRNELAVFVQNAQTFNGGMVIWDTISDQFLQHITNNPAYALFNESGDKIAFIDYDNSSAVQIWSTETWQPVMSLAGYDIRAAIFSWKNETLSVFGADGNTRLWDTSSGEILLEVELGSLQNAPLLNATATNMLVIGRGGGYRYDTITGQLLSSLGTTPTLTEIQVYDANNGNYIINIQNGSVIDLQSTDTSNLIFQSNFTNVDEIWRVKFQINEDLENSDDSVPYQSIQWQAEVGTHTLSITPLIGDEVSNAAGYPMIIDFSIVDSASSDLISNISHYQGHNYTHDNSLAVGDTVYQDRSYTFTQVDAALLGAELIQTQNNDKLQSNDPTVTFTLSDAATGYVGYDSRHPAPAWLSGWQLTGYTLESTDGAGNLSRNVYAKTFPAGQVTLDSTACPNSQCSAYVIMAQP